MSVLSTGQFTPTERPRIVDGLVVQAVSANSDPRTRVAAFGADGIEVVRTAPRAVGCYLKGGRWIVLSVHDDPAERDEVLAGFLDELADWRSR